MPFVKLDCGLLNSSLWVDKPARDLFITALLLAEPRVYDNKIPQIKIQSLDYTGWEAPPGWYGFVPAASPGLINRALIDPEEGRKALERLGEPDESSRSDLYEGRRMIRIDGGFIILNYDKYRQRDYTNAERQARWRNRNSNTVTPKNNAVTKRYITQAEAEADSTRGVHLDRRRGNGESPQGFAVAKKRQGWQLSKDLARLEKQYQEAKEACSPDLALIAGIKNQLKQVREEIREMGK